jgi:general secretion pathway protein D
MHHQCSIYKSLLVKILVVVLLVGLGGCASHLKVADNYIAQQEWMKAVLEVRKAAADNPSNIEFKLRLKQIELKAADYYYKRGLGLFEREDLEGAAVEFQLGLTAMPDNDKLQQAMKQVLLRKEADILYIEALHLIDAGKQNEGYRLLMRVVEIDPKFNRAVDLIAGIDRQNESDDDSDRLKVNSDSPITLNFRQTDLRTAFEFVAKSFGIDVVFDESVKTMPITLFAKDVEFEQALSLMLSTTKTFYKRVGSNTILIAPDSKEKRGQYEDQLVRVFQLTNIHSKAMADILKSIVPLKKIIVNDELNTIVVRDTEEAIKVAGKVIEANDRRPAELVLEVEILEVNRSKAIRLGLDLSPYRISAAVPTSANLPLSGGIGRGFQNNAILTLPSATLNFYRQDVDAKTLANPRLRVLSGKNAKIHIGDRVPLRASTIQDATGQIRTTYDYKDIGIRLVAEPIIHLDNSVTVKVNLEVSSLGQNMGTLEEPAFSIGTRNAETFMLLRDGETAILGGLIRDEDRTTSLRVPLVGDIPAIGRLFASNEDTSGSTDVLLTITPRVVRSWDMPGKDASMFISGAEDRYTTQPLFGSFAAPRQADKRAALRPPDGGGSNKVKPEAGEGAAVKEPVTVQPPVTFGQQPLFAFSDAVYQSAIGKEFEIELTADHLDGVTDLSTELQFNPQFMKYLRNEPGSFATTGYKVDADEAQGVLRIKLIYPEKEPAQGSGVLARIVMQGGHPGTSYVVYRAPMLHGAGGESGNVQLRASRVVVK